MRNELMTYGFYYLALVVAFASAILFGVEGEWWAMFWALLCSSYVWLALKTLKRKDVLEEQFREYVSKESVASE